jgi:CRISPR-associated protein Csh1
MNVALKHLARLLGSGSLVEPVPRDCTNVIEVELLAEEGRINRIVLATFDTDGAAKYLYRKSTPNSTGPTITYPITTKASANDRRSLEQRAQSVFENKFIRYLQEMAQNQDAEISSFAKRALEAVGDSQEEIGRVQQLCKQIAPAKALITLVLVHKDGRRHYPGEIEALRRYFSQRSDPFTKKRSTLDSFGTDAHCSCCGKRHDEVSLPPPQTLSYFTIDKPGFIAGGFNAKRAWRNFPLCAECSLSIRAGHRAAQDHLRFSLCGIQYLLIPTFADWTGQTFTSLVRNMAEWRKAADTETQRDHELLFAHRFARERATASLTYLFYRMKNSRMEILCTLEGVLPSRLAEVANAADRAGSHWLLARFGEWAKMPTINAITIDFRIIRDLYQPHTEGKKEPPCHSFLRAVQRTVYGQAFDLGEFFDAAIAYVRQDLRSQQSNGKEPWLAFSVHRALAAALWLQQLKIIDFVVPGEMIQQSKGDSMSDIPHLNDEGLNDRFDEFFQTFSGLFAQEEQRVCYLMGVLCAQVLSEQRQRYDNRQPFFRNLKDLTLNEREMRGLLSKIKIKLVEYDIDHFYWGLEQAVAERFRRANFPWMITNSEINFFFTLGLSEARIFRAKASDQPSTAQEQRQ